MVVPEVDPSASLDVDDASERAEVPELPASEELEFEEAPDPFLPDELEAPRDVSLPDFEVELLAAPSVEEVVSSLTVVSSACSELADCCTEELLLELLPDELEPEELLLELLPDEPDPDELLLELLPEELDPGELLLELLLEDPCSSAAASSVVAEAELDELLPLFFPLLDELSPLTASDDPSSACASKALSDGAASRPTSCAEVAQAAPPAKPASRTAVNADVILIAKLFSFSILHLISADCQPDSLSEMQD